MSPTPLDILRYYRQCIEALDALKRRIQPSLHTGTLEPTSGFFGMTPDEFNTSLVALRTELDYQVVMMLTASFEAIFQSDLQDRVRRKKKDPASKALRQWWKTNQCGTGKWIHMESLLDAWKKASPGHRQTIGRLRSLVLFRHWLAHGRYWPDKSGLGTVDPFTAWEIGKRAFAILPGLPSLPPW
jgi:hypothetical protein